MKDRDNNLGGSSSSTMRRSALLLLLLCRSSRGYYCCSSLALALRGGRAPSLTHQRGLCIDKRARRQHTRRSATDDDSTDTNVAVARSPVFSQTLLIAGTTIGGGFLALPRATSPGGFLPSSLGLIASWLYLLSSSFALADATILTTTMTTTKSGSENVVSVFSIAQASFGRRASTAVGLSFCVLIISTLVAQLSKSGALLSDLLGGNARMLTLLFSLLTAGVTWARGQAFAETCNNFLTTLMLTSFAAVAVFAARVATDVPSRLLRADWSSLLPLGSHVWSIPVLLQLLVYSETVPYVTRRLYGDRGKIRQALTFGSFIPLCMCLVWSAATLAVVPFTASKIMIDPVHRLLSMSGGGLELRLLKASILTLAGSAISTTVIGSLLTMTQFLQDVFRVDDSAASNTKTMALRAAALLPCTLIAAFGGSGLYYAATAFAGSFPVVLLWGLFPPLAHINLQLKNQPLRKGAKKIALVVPILTITASVLMVGINAYNAYKLL